MCWASHGASRLAWVCTHFAPGSHRCLAGLRPSWLHDACTGSALYCMHCCHVAVSPAWCCCRAHTHTQVMLGASAVLSNGTVLSRAGSAAVAMTAHASSKPVLVCCEAFKVWRGRWDAADAWLVTVLAEQHMSVFLARSQT